MRFTVLAMFVLSCTPTVAATWSLKVQVDRVVYRPNEAGKARITVTAPAGARGRVTMLARLEHGLGRFKKLPNLPIQLPISNPITLTFKPPTSKWGCRFVVQLKQGDKLLAESTDVFAVGTEPFRLGQPNNHGGVLDKNSVKSFQGEDGFWPTKWREMKGTWLETFSALPCEFNGLTTPWDEWITMQSKYRMSKAGIRAFIKAAHRLGIKVMMYNNATPSGWVGTAWARQNPQWLTYNRMGGMRADLRVKDIESMKTWHRTLSPSPTIAAFQPIYPNFFDPKLTQFGCQQMLEACRDFGYDGVRFDGHWILGDVASSFGYDMQGRRPNRGQSVDSINTRIIRDIRKLTRAQRADFSIGFNYGDNYERGGARSPGAYRLACADGGMVLWEGAAFGGALSDWRRGALKLRENALRVHQNGGVHYGQSHMTHITKYPCNDFSLRYYYITNFAATSHIYSGLYPGHPNYRAIQGLYYRFALRYSELLYDRALRPLSHPERHLSVTVAGTTSNDLWWKPYTYKRQLKGKYQLITHLVNMPAQGVTKETSTPDKQPTPLKDVLISLRRRPVRMFLLDPETPRWQTTLAAKKSISIKRLKSWKILVQEFPGSCADLPTEVIPSFSMRGRDRAPDAVNGRVVLPISLLTNGDICSRLVQDDAASLGYSLRCQGADVASKDPIVLYGPSQGMPNVAPGRVRITLRMKVSNNSFNKPVCTILGRFGRRQILASTFSKANVFQDVAFDYQMREGESNAIIVHYHGTTDVWFDAVALQQLSSTKDRDLFTPQSLTAGLGNRRRGSSKSAHIVRGLWHDFFGFDAALQRAKMKVESSWATLSTSLASIPVDLPATVEELMRHDLVALLNVPAENLQPARRRNLREYVMRGGTLFVGGGPSAFGHGGYANTFLADLLPVTLKRFDLNRAVGQSRLISATNHPLTRGVSFQTPPQNYFYHQVRARRRAEIILKAGDTPILTRWRVGHGTVYAFTGTPCGDGKSSWWSSNAWKHVLDRILSLASPDKRPTYAPGSAEVGKLLGRVRGTSNLQMIVGDKTIAPVTAEGVMATPRGVSLGYGQGKKAKGVLLYPAGLIKPRGSITFKITPGWETNFTELDRSVQLFETKSVTHSGVLQIYIYVHSANNYALAVHVSTNEIGRKPLLGRSAMYAIKRANVGSGNSLLKTSLWKKGQTRTIRISWSPSQFVISEDGKRMAVSDFAPELDFTSFSGPLYVGSSSSQRLARVLMKDIEIRGDAKSK